MRTTGAPKDQIKEEQTMKTLFKKMETVFAAAAFAEEGEFETARQIVNEEKQARKTDRPSVHDAKRPAARPTLRVD
jgi:hypothetical protein